MACSWRINYKRPDSAAQLFRQMRTNGLNSSAQRLQRGDAPLLKLYSNMRAARLTTDIGSVTSRVRIPIEPEREWTRSLISPGCNLHANFLCALQWCEIDGGNRTYFRPPTRAPKCRARRSSWWQFSLWREENFRFCVAAEMVALTRHAFQLEVLLSEPSVCGFAITPHVKF